MNTTISATVTITDAPANRNRPVLTVVTFRSRVAAERFAQWLGADNIRPTVFDGWGYTRNGNTFRALGTTIDPRTATVHVARMVDAYGDWTPGTIPDTAWAFEPTPAMTAMDARVVSVTNANGEPFNPNETPAMDAGYASHVERLADDEQTADDVANACDYDEREYGVMVCTSGTGINPATLAEWVTRETFEKWGTTDNAYVSGGASVWFPWQSAECARQMVAQFVFTQPDEWDTPTDEPTMAERRFTYRIERRNGVVSDGATDYASWVSDTMAAIADDVATGEIVAFSFRDTWPNPNTDNDPDASHGMPTDAPTMTDTAHADPETTQTPSEPQTGRDGAENGINGETCGECDNRAPWHQMTCSHVRVTRPAIVAPNADRSDAHAIEIVNAAYDGEFPSDAHVVEWARVAIPDTRSAVLPIIPRWGLLRGCVGFGVVATDDDTDPRPLADFAEYVRGRGYTANAYDVPTASGQPMDPDALPHVAIYHTAGDAHTGSDVLPVIYAQLVREWHHSRRVVDAMEPETRHAWGNPFRYAGFDPDADECADIARDIASLLGVNNTTETAVSLAVYRLARHIVTADAMGENDPTENDHTHVRTAFRRLTGLMMPYPAE